jgi:uncharacterized membrane protein
MQVTVIEMLLLLYFILINLRALTRERSNKHERTYYADILSAVNVT